MNKNEYRRLVSDTLAYLSPNPPQPRAAAPKKVEPPKATKEVVAPPAKVPPPIAKVEIEVKPKAPPQPVAEPTEELRRLILKAAPHMALHRDIPSDEGARLQANRWKEGLRSAEIGILSFGESGPLLAFLKNLASAIDIHLRPAELIDGLQMDREKRWGGLLEAGHLKWFISPSRGIGKSTDLVRYYRENPTTQERFLGSIPIFFLSPFQEYFKNPALKRSVWNTLCQLLKK